ncbi:unnamed protein product, partial [Rotaria sp. Silwood2]
LREQSMRFDEKKADDNLINIDRALPESNYVDQHIYSDQYHPYMYSSSSVHSHYNNNNNHHHRIDNNSRHTNNVPTNDDIDSQSRHSDDYSD